MMMMMMKLGVVVVVVVVDDDDVDEDVDDVSAAFMIPLTHRNLIVYDQTEMDDNGAMQMAV